MWYKHITEHQTPEKWGKLIDTNMNELQKHFGEEEKENTSEYVLYDSTQE